MKPILFLILLCSVLYCCADPTEKTDEEKQKEFDKFLRLAAWQNKQCSARHREYVHIPCMTHGMKFDEKIRSTPLTADNLQSFKKSCDNHDQCIFLYYCSGEQALRLAAQRMYQFCALEVYSKTEFADCAAKLEKAGSECYKDYGKFPEVVFPDKGDDDEKARQSTACGKFFGKNFCMEGEIKSHCGEDEWKKFRDHYVDLNPRLMNCSLPYDFPYGVPNKPFNPQAELE